MTKNDQDQMHPEDLKNLLTFIIAAVLIWVVFDHYLLKPKMDALRVAQEARQTAQMSGGGIPGQADGPAAMRPRGAVIGESPRIKIETDTLSGSIALTGGRLDDISLRKHYTTHEKNEPVSLFSPTGSLHAQYASFGWSDPANKIKTPEKDSVWQVAGDASAVLKPGQPVTIYWENGQGLRFERDMDIDDGYLIKVTQRVINKSGQNVTLYPYALMAQHGLPEDMYGSWTIHEGPIGYIGGELVELSYKKIKDKAPREIDSGKGWIAITSRYWLTGMFPEDESNNKFRFVYVSPEESGQPQPRYQIDVMGAGKTVKPGESFETATRLFVGPKMLKTLENYGKALGWTHIDLSIDFGMYYFMTKPLYSLLHWLGDVSGNFGIGIILLTFVVRIFVFPLANTSYRSFANLRKISPQMTELREKYKDDKDKLQAGLVELYEKEKVNPMAGCLPILIQIPIFFALFKVLQLSVEMRHAPFYGWVHDLSAPDPTSIFNLFGLIPWNPPEPMMIGIWPCAMLVFMILQKKMSPPPQDKMQKTMMDIMPFFITYILSKYAVGLVIYWTFSNALSVVQQYIIMKSMGVEPHLFRSKEQKALEKKIASGPAVHPELVVVEHEVEDALFGEEDKEIKTVSAPKPKKSRKKK